MEIIFTMRQLRIELRACRTFAQVKSIWLRCRPEPKPDRLGRVNSNYNPGRWATKITRREKELAQ